MKIPHLLMFLSYVVMVTSQHNHLEEHIHEELSINMDSTYCNDKGYNDAQEIQLKKDTSWHVIWSGYGVGDGDFCGVMFTRPNKDMDDADVHTMCITPEVFNVSDCDTTVEFYEIDNVVSETPSKVFNCTYGQRISFCTKKSTVKIIVESLRDNDSQFQLHIEVPQSNISDSNNNNNNNNNVGSKIHSYLSTSLVFMMIFANTITL